MCDKNASKEIFMLKYCPDRYKTKKMCDKAVDACLSSLKFVPDWLVTSIMREIHNDVVFSNDDIDLYYIDSDVVTVFCNDMGINIIDLNNINFDDDKFGKDDLETIIHVILLAWCNEYKKRKTFKALGLVCARR